MSALQQRRAAIDRANTIRITGYAIKARMAALPRHTAPLEAAHMLADDWEPFGHMRIHEFLEAVPGIGDDRVRRILVRAGTGFPVWPLRRVRDLTDRERRRVSYALTQICRPA